MKLITLNIWGGKIYEPFINFVKNKAAEVDIFCLQDVSFGSNSEFTPKRQGRINILSELKELLSDFRGSFLIK